MKFKRLLLSVVFIFVISALLINAAVSATYYVKNGGNDSADGLSDANAWATISQVNNFAEQFKDGDVICFKRGDTFDDQTLGYDGSDINWGTISNLTFRDYSTGEKPKFNSEKVQPIRIASSSLSNLTIMNIEIYGSGSAGSWKNGTAIWISLVDGVTIDGVDGDGRVGGLPSTPAGVIRLYNVIGNAEIKNCNLYGWGPSTNPSSNALDTMVFIVWATLEERGPTSVSIHDNVVHSINSDAVLIGNFQGTPSTTCDIYDNIFYNCGENAIDIKASTYVKIYRNKMYRDNWGLGGTGSSGCLIVVHRSRSFPGERCDEIRIYQNAFTGNNDGTYTRPGIGYLTGEIEDMYIYNNTFTNVSPAIYAYSGNFKIEDNVFVANKPLNIDSSLKTFIRQEATAIIKNNTFYASSDSTIETGIWHNNGKQSEYVNNIICLNTKSNNSYAHPLYVLKGTGDLPTVFYNAIDNPNHQNRIYWDGTKYGVADLSGWRNAADAGALFVDPFFKDAGKGDFSLFGSSPCILQNRTLGAYQNTDIFPSPKDLRTIK